jgi:hypothetical protein
MGRSVPSLLYVEEADRLHPSTRPNEQRPRIPFLGLTQACTQIRSEFRPWWLDAHYVPLCAIKRYLSIFLRDPPTKKRNQFCTHFNPSGTLRLWIRKCDLERVDILCLLKFKAKYLDYKIEPRGLFNILPEFDIPLELLLDFDRVINNRNPNWLHLIRGNKVTQVRIQSGWVSRSSRAASELYVVMREQWGENWMKPSLRRRPPREYLVNLGLWGNGYWLTRFALCY